MSINSFIYIGAVGKLSRTLKKAENMGTNNTRKECKKDEW